MVIKGIHKDPKEKSKTKKKPFNVKKAKKQLDIQWSLVIRGRDKICRRCKKAPASQAAHIFTRNNLSTRWDSENGFGMCYYCHIIWAHREPIEFTLWTQEEIGMARFVALREKTKQISPLTKDRAEEIKVSLK